jgi:hypothetical protein
MLVGSEVGVKVGGTGILVGVGAGEDVGVGVGALVGVGIKATSLLYSPGSSDKNAAS